VADHLLNLQTAPANATPQQKHQVTAKNDALHSLGEIVYVHLKTIEVFPEDLEHFLLISQ
jgi:hypothetical protein